MYWRELGQELDHESHVATIDELAKASFPIYVCQQELGGFVIVPPRSCHQVVNSGGLTFKTSWSRMIGKSYMLSLSQELRIYQRYIVLTCMFHSSLIYSHSVCRPEVYRVKATIAAVVSLCSERLHTRRTDRDSDLDLVFRLGYFLPLYKQMLIETYDPHWKTYETRTLDGESCDCCGADIWQSAMICASCSPEVGGAADNARTPVIICGPCYVDGRSCACETMQPAQARPFDELIDLANNAVTLLNFNQKNKQGSVIEQLSEKYCHARYPLSLLNFIFQGSHFGHPSTDFSRSCPLVSISHVDQTGEI
jgi:JmjC domain, hydroxylase